MHLTPYKRSSCNGRAASDLCVELSDITKLVTYHTYLEWTKLSIARREGRPNCRNYATIPITPPRQFADRPPGIVEGPTWTGV